MRTLSVAGALAGSLLALAATSGFAQDAPPPPSQPLLTPEQNGAANLGNAASAPMHDMNIFRQKIPPVLLQAITDPYARPPRSCAALDARILELDAALGPDLDTPASPVRGKDGMTLPLLHMLSEMLLPFSGAVRTITGARAHDQQVLAAIIAGGVRRGYLKGLGEAHGCYPPATPRHVYPSPPPVIEEGHSHPRYPSQ